MYIARTSFDAMAADVLFPEILAASLNLGFVVVMPYNEAKKRFGDMEAAIMFIPDAMDYAKKLEKVWARSFWAVSYDSKTGMVKIHC